jgi:hypothetical protein
MLSSLSVQNLSYKEEKNISIHTCVPMLNNVFFAFNSWAAQASLSVPGEIFMPSSVMFIDGEGKSAGSFCQQVAAWVLGMFCKFYLVKNHKIAKIQHPLKAEKKIRTDLEFLEFYYVCLTKFKNN